ncbi:co-chaperonin groes (hsP10) [Caudoviricetes sp.]|nr:co-chaperonin groes (hsP10) [Caudoviricetes sp.]
MKLRPLKDRIVVKPISRIKSSIIDVVMSEKDNMGNIVAIGDQAKNHLHIGEFVRFGTMGKDEYLNYQEYFEDGERYLIMSWKDICFISEENHAA